MNAKAGYIPSGVYSRPSYLDETWDSLKAILETGSLLHPETAIPLTTFQDLVRSLHWDEDLVLLEELIADQYHRSDAQKLQFFKVDLTNPDGSCECNFGLPDRDADNKLEAVVAMSAQQKDGTKVPLNDAVQGVFRSELIIRTGVEENTQLVRHELPDLGGVEAGIWNFYYSQKALELYTVALGKLLVRTKPELTKRMAEKDDPIAGTSAKGLLALLKAAHASDAAPQADEAMKDALADIGFVKAYEDCFNAFHHLTQLRLLQIVYLAGLCVDRESAFDWMCSIDGPLFCGHNAAELSINFSQLYEDSDWLNLLAVSDQKPEK